MLSESIIGAIVEAIVGYTLDQSGLGDWVHSRLRGASAKRALTRALTAALDSTAQKHPAEVASLFDTSFLQHEGAQVIGQLLWRHGRPTGSALAETWPTACICQLKPESASCKI